MTAVQAGMKTLTDRTNEIITWSRSYSREVADIWDHLLMAETIEKVERALNTFKYVSDKLMSDLSNAQRSIVTISMLPVCRVTGGSHTLSPNPIVQVRGS